MDRSVQFYIFLFSFVFRFLQEFGMQLCDVCDLCRTHVLNLLECVYPQFTYYALAADLIVFFTF